MKAASFSELTVAMIETSNDIRNVAIMIPAKMLYSFTEPTACVLDIMSDKFEDINKNSDHDQSDRFGVHGNQLFMLTLFPDSY